MPDFTLKISDSVHLVDWLDPASSTKPRRLNPKDGHPSKRYVAYFEILERTIGALTVPMSLGATITLTAIYGGVEGPLDSALGGRLFRGDMHEWPTLAFGCTSPAGQSSVQTFTIPDRPEYAGSYTIGMRHEGGGAIFVHIDVEPLPT